MTEAQQTELANMICAVMEHFDELWNLLTPERRDAVIALLQATEGTLSPDHAETADMFLSVTL